MVVTLRLRLSAALAAFTSVEGEAKILSTFRKHQRGFMVKTKLACRVLTVVRQLRLLDICWEP